MKIGRLGRCFYVYSAHARMFIPGRLYKCLNVYAIVQLMFVPALKYCSCLLYSNSSMRHIVFSFASPFEVCVFTRYCAFEAYEKTVSNEFLLISKSTKNVLHCRACTSLVTEHVFMMLIKFKAKINGM